MRISNNITASTPTGIQCQHDRPPTSPWKSLSSGSRINRRRGRRRRPLDFREDALADSRLTQGTRNAEDGVLIPADGGGALSEVSGHAHPHEGAVHPGDQRHLLDR